MHNKQLQPHLKKRRWQRLLTALIGCWLFSCPQQSHAQSGAAKGNLGKIVREIEMKCTSYKILYDFDNLQNRQVSPLPDLSRQSCEEALTWLQKAGYIRYRIEGKFISIALIPAAANSKAPGQLSGTVTDEETKVPVPGATITINGQAITTDENGAFIITLPKGGYEAAVSTVGYGTKKITEIIIRDNETFTIDIPLKRVKGQLGAVTVSARRIRETGTNAAMVNEIREADAVVSGISKEQIARSQDRDAAEVIQRVSGVSIIQNRMVIIRGLPQRYNTVMLDNVIAPSFEPDSRAFSFDILPAGFIDRIMIYKTAVPELPGDFAGGVIKVYTTGMPQRNSFNISYSASANSNTTFNDFYEQPQGKKSWLGYDDGTYNLPKEVSGRLDLLTDEQRKLLTPRFNTNWDVAAKKAPVDHRFNLDFTRRIGIGRRSRLGITGAFNYSNTRQYTVIAQNTASLMNGVYAMAYQFADQSSTHNVRLNGMLNLSLDINPNHRIGIKSLYTHMGSTNSIVRNGLTGDAASDGSGLYLGQYVRQYILNNAYREIWSAQVTGQHKLFSKTQVNWLAGYTKSNYNDPDQRYRTLKQDTALYYNDSSLIENIQGGYYRGRRYFTLPEETKTVSAEVIQPITIADKEFTIKGGFFYEHKERTFNFRQMVYTPDPEIKYSISENYGKNNSYNAGNVLKAGYLALDIPITKRLKLYGGLRIEDNTQELHTYTYQLNVPNDGRIDLNRKQTSFLPSVNASYDITDQTLLRASYSKTLNRPEFREISTFYYLDMMTYRLAYGNENLKIQTDIDNFDLRLEHYPGAGEMITAGVFYKKFKNPIEYYFYAGSGGYNNFQWGNANAATNYGAEVELMVGLRRWVGGENTFSKTLQRLSVLLNATWIQSRVDLGGRAGLQDKKRALYGQSPYLVNVAINYTQDSIGLRINANYNIIGKRLSAIGNLSSPNIYEMPRHSLDISFSKRLYRDVEIKGGIQNVLNGRYLFLQTDKEIKQLASRTDKTINGDNIYQSNYAGAYYTLGIGIQL